MGTHKEYGLTSWGWGPLNWNSYILASLGLMTMSTLQQSRVFCLAACPYVHAGQLLLL